MTALIMLGVAVVILLIVLAYRACQSEIEHGKKDSDYPGPG